MIFLSVSRISKLVFWKGILKLIEGLQIGLQIHIAIFKFFQCLKILKIIREKPAKSTVFYADFKTLTIIEVTKLHSLQLYNLSIVFKNLYWLKPQYDTL